jgi:2-C-methyl-D-erythritol 4-phosphate cytidylyltransferase
MRTAIVVAGGSGERFGRPGGKQLAEVAGAPVVVHALRAMESAASVDHVVLVCAPSRVEEFEHAVASAGGLTKMRGIVAGGSTRQSSVAAGLLALPSGTEVVVVHDGARPLTDPETIDRAVAELATSGATGVVVGHPAVDTVKSVSMSGDVTGTPRRTDLWVAQTPQVFRASELIAAYARAAAEGWEGTDDASLVERAGGRVRMLEGSRWNIKVTVAEDIVVVAALLRARTGGGCE